jgi:branched-chain amino acid transport system permease protein
MSKILQTLVDGLANGAIYASLALALVLVHRATHIPNFAQGELAMVSAFIAWEVQTRLSTEGQSPSVMIFVAAITVSMVLSFLLGFLIERGIIRWVENASPLTLLIVTLGLLQIINNGAGWYWGFLPEVLRSPFPPQPIRLGDVVLKWNSIGIVIVVMALMALVFVLFKHTKLGLGLRGAAGNPNSARLVGINVGLMLAVGWGLAALVGSTAGVMAAPSLGLNPNMLASVILFAFAGAVLGGFDSPPGAVVGGLLVGLLQTFTGVYWTPHGNQLSTVIAFVVILAVLLVKPNGLFGKAEVSRV